MKEVGTILKRHYDGKFFTITEQRGWWNFTIESLDGETKDVKRSEIEIFYKAQ